MGLWQKLLGWLNPSAPTAAHAPSIEAPSPDAAVAPGLESRFGVAQEPAFDTGVELTRPKPVAAEDALHATPADEAAERPQPDLPDATAPQEGEGVPPAINNQTLRDVLSTYAGMAWDRQIDFAETVGDRPWSADTSQGTIQFGDDLRFRMQVLGSYAFQSGTWQWIWANTQAEVAPACTEVARQLVGLGQAQQLPLFTDPRTELREEDLHVIGLIAAGADECAGYYLGNYGDGILLALIDPGHGLPSAAIGRPERVLTVVPQLISQFALNHRLLLRHYLEAKGFVLQETATQITGRLGTHRIVAELDDQGRMTALNGHLAA